ncbi:MAG: diguanylate cyclase [Burkholderiales bacterium]|nr:diguanylate cyclase [Burkholderiales bacterium]
MPKLGSDEFVALVTRYADDEDLRQLARRLIGQVHAGAQAEYAGRFDIGLSIGIATFPDRVRHLRQLIDAADTAMYAAKGEQSSTFRFASATKNDSAYSISAGKHD